ncbi:MAG: hypothetical protein MJE68_13535, partial [Proteobacteria bacterium]|nr:hypothetical protein [Pseudomonadota bacterium]
HFRTFPDVPDAWHNEALARRIQQVRSARNLVLSALEGERVAGRVKSSLAAEAHLYAPKAIADAFHGLTPADIFITSQAEVAHAKPPKTDKGITIYTDDEGDMGVVINKAQGEKCDRCWKIQPSKEMKDLLGGRVCGRCQGVVGVA